MPDPKNIESMAVIWTITKFTAPFLVAACIGGYIGYYFDIRKKFVDTKIDKLQFLHEKTSEILDFIHLAPLAYDQGSYFPDMLAERSSELFGASGISQDKVFLPKIISDKIRECQRQLISISIFEPLEDMFRIHYMSGHPSVSIDEFIANCRGLHLTIEKRLKRLRIFFF